MLRKSFRFLTRIHQMTAAGGVQGPQLCQLKGRCSGNAAEMAVIELLGAEQELNEKAQKRAEAREKKREEMQKQLEAQGPGEAPDPNAEP